MDVCECCGRDAATIVRLDHEGSAVMLCAGCSDLLTDEVDGAQ